MEIIGFVIIEISIILIGAFLFSYSKKKAENLATKEDITEITKKVEAVKHEYSSKLESVKTVLCARLFTQQVRYQNEFNILVSLSEKLTELRQALSNFEFQFLSNKQKAENFVDTKQAAEKTLSAMGALMEEYEAHKPFYPQEIYDSVNKLHSLSWTKLFLKGHKENLIGISTVSKAMSEIANKYNQSSDFEEIPDVIEKIYAAIRKRVQYWEEIHIE